MLIYGATAVATEAVAATVAAQPALYGQGDPATFAPRDDRVKAGLRLLTDHGFQLPYLHREHPRIELPRDGFALEQAVIPAGMKFSGLGEGSGPRHYRPDDPADFRQFSAARSEARSLGYQFYRGKMPFGPAEFFVEGIQSEGDFNAQIFEGQIGRVELYNPYTGGEQNGGAAYETAMVSIRRFLDLNPEFAEFAGFAHGWRAKPSSSWTLWEMLQAQSDVSGFSVEGEGGWHLDSSFGLTILISDPKTGVISLIHEDGRRVFMTLENALRQARSAVTIGWRPEQRVGKHTGFGNTSYMLDPEDRLTVKPIMLLVKTLGVGGSMGASISIPRKPY